MPLWDLRKGYDSLHRALEDGRPSRYALQVTPPEPLDDSIPFLDAAAPAVEKPKLRVKAGSNGTHAEVPADA
jgi:hypothetical protein